MSTLTDRTIATLRANHDDLAARVASFDEADLTRPSGSSEWDVAQVLSHLGSGAEIALAGLKAALDEETAPGQDFNLSVWDRWNAMSRRQQADGFLIANERLVSACEGLDEATRTELRVTLGFLPSPVDLALITGLRLSEAVQHAWDVKVAFDPTATLTDLEAANALDQLSGPLAFMLGFLGKADRLAGSATLRVETSGPARTFTLAITDQVALVDGSGTADAVLTAPAEAVVRLLGGRLRPEFTPEAVVVTGALTLDQLRDVFPGN